MYALGVRCCFSSLPRRVVGSGPQVVELVATPTRTWARKRACPRVVGCNIEGLCLRGASAVGSSLACELRRDPFFLFSLDVFGGCEKSCHHFRSALLSDQMPLAPFDKYPVTPYPVISSVLARKPSMPLEHMILLFVLFVPHGRVMLLCLFSLLNCCAPAGRPLRVGYCRTSAGRAAASPCRRRKALDRYSSQTHDNKSRREKT